MLVSFLAAGIWDFAKGILSDANPVDFANTALDYILGAAGGVGAEVKTAIRNAVVWCLDRAAELVRIVSNGLDFTSGLLVDAVNAARALGQSALDGIVDIVEHKIPDAVGWVTGIIGDVRDELLAGINGLRAWASDTFGFIGAVFHNLEDEVLNHLIPDIWGWINGAGDWIYHTFILPVLQQASAWYHEVRDAADWLIGQVGSLWDWANNIAIPAIALVLEAAEWIAWFALHPITALHHLFDDVMHRAPDYILSGVLRAVESNGSVLEDWVVNWLGH